jgi:hypothetical protein
MYIERGTVSEEDAYSYHLYMPVKCRCGAIDEYINRAKKSCRSIKNELSALLDILRRQQGVSNKIGDITAELNKRFVSPSFLQSVGKDFMFSFKVFGILLGSVIGVEIFLFIISSLMFFFGLVFSMPDLSRAGNELFYHVNIFKDLGGSFLSRFGMAETYEPLNVYLASEQLIYNYIPYAVAGFIIIVFYAFLAVLFVRIAINIAKVTFFASKVVNQKIKVAQRREEYRRQLDDLGIIYQNLAEQIGEIAILPADYKNLRAAETIFRFFINNRTDNIREALNLFHEEDFRNRMLEYQKGVYNESRQTRRYTKALYMLTSDDNIKVDVRDVREEPSESDNSKVGDMLKDAFSKIKKPATQKQIQMDTDTGSSHPVLSLPNPFKRKPKEDAPDGSGTETDESESLGGTTTDDGDDNDNYNNNSSEINLNTIFDDDPDLDPSDRPDRSEREE